jgi:hypothetical protein
MNMYYVDIQAVTCSGVQKDGSLRIVRSGIGINEQVRCASYKALSILCAELHNCNRWNIISSTTRQY